MKISLRRKKKIKKQGAMPGGKTFLGAEFKQCYERANKKRGGLFIRRISCFTRSIRFDRKFLKKLVGLALIVSLFYFGVKYVPQLPLFSIQNVTVESIGGHPFVNIDTEEITNIMKSSDNENYFSLNPKEYENELLEYDNRIKAVYIEKHFPNGAKVFIQERVPVVTIYSRGSCILVAEDGYVLSVDSDVSGGELEDGQTHEGIPCLFQIVRYLTDYVEMSDGMAKFEVGSKSNAYTIDGLLSIRETSQKYGYSIEKIVVKDSIAYIILGGDNLLNLIVDFDKSVKEQLMRFEIIMEYTPTIVKEYSSIDLRFERPVLIK